MEYDVVLKRKDGSVRHFCIYGRPAPSAGDIVTLPIDGKLIKARVGEICDASLSRVELVESFDHVHPADLERV